MLAQTQVPSVKEIYSTFIDTLDSGFGALEGDVATLFNLLLSISLALACFQWMFGTIDDVLKGLVMKVIFVGIFAFLVENWQPIVNTAWNTFAAAGYKAGGSPKTGPADPTTSAGKGRTLLAPDQVLRDAQKHILPIQKAISAKITGINSFFQNLPDILFLAWALVVLLLTYMIVAATIVVTVVSFKIGTLIAFFLIPWGLLSRTAEFIARPIQWVLGACIRVMALAIILGITDKFFQSITIAPDIDAPQAFQLSMSVFILAIFVIIVPRIALELSVGSPSIGLGAAFAAAAPFAAATGLTLRAGAQAAWQGLKGAGRGAAGAYRAAAKRINKK